MADTGEWAVVAFGGQSLPGPMAFRDVVQQWLDQEVFFGNSRPVVVRDEHGAIVRGTPGRDGVRESIAHVKLDRVEHGGGTLFIGQGTVQDDEHALELLCQLYDDWQRLTESPLLETLKVTVSPFPDGKGTRAKNLTLANSAKREGRSRLVLQPQDDGGLGVEGSQGLPVLGPAISEWAERGGAGDAAATITAVGKTLASSQRLADTLFGLVFHRLEQLQQMEERCFERAMRLSEAGPAYQLEQLRLHAAAREAELDRLQRTELETQRRKNDVLAAGVQVIGGTLGQSPEVQAAAAKLLERATPEQVGAIATALGGGRS